MYLSLRFKEKEKISPSLIINNLIQKYFDTNRAEILLFLVFLYLSLAYFSLALPNITLTILVSVFIGYGIYKRKYFFIKKQYSYYLLLAIPILLVISFVFRTSDYDFFFSKLLQKSPSFLVPLILLSFLQNKAQLKNLAGFFIIASLIALLITLFRLFSLYGTEVHFKRGLFEQATIIQHLYFGVYQLVAIIFLLEFYKNSLKKYVFYLLFFALSLGVAISTSRISYILYFLLVGLYLMRYLPRRKALIYFLVLSGLAVSVIFTIPQLKQKFTQSFNPKTSPRLIIWNNAYLILKNAENPWLGTGLDYYKDGSTGTYWLKGLAEQENYNGVAGFNTHNQFFEFILLGGVLGFLYVFLMFFTLYKAIASKDVFLISLILLLFLFSMVENILDRQWGIILFSVLMGILYSGFSRKKF